MLSKFLAILLNRFREVGVGLGKEVGNIMLLGCVYDNTRGNIPALHSPIQGLDALASVCVSDVNVPADSMALALKQYVL